MRLILLAAAILGLVGCITSHSKSSGKAVSSPSADTVARANLRILSMATEAYILPDSRFVVAVTVINDGKAASANSRVQMDIPDAGGLPDLALADPYLPRLGLIFMTVVSPVKSLAPGETTAVVATIRAPSAGFVHVTATVDPNHEIDEEHEDDNAATLVVPIGSVGVARGGSPRPAAADDF